MNTEFQTLTVTELRNMQFDPKVTESEEQGYRRGYWHGYAQAMDDALVAGAKRCKWWTRLAYFFDEHVTGWYHSADQSDRAYPPTYERQR